MVRMSSGAEITLRGVQRSDSFAERSEALASRSGSHQTALVLKIDDSKLADLRSAFADPATSCEETILLPTCN